MNRIKTFGCLLLACAGMLAHVAVAEVPVVPSPGHPRVLLRPDDLARIRAERNDPALAAAYAELHRRANLPDDFQPEPRYDLAVQRAAEATAFLGMVDDDHSLKRRAIELGFQLLGPEPNMKATYFERQALGRCISTVAQVYDWCHDALTPAERKELTRMFRAHASALEMGFPPRVPGAISGHSSGMQLLREMMAMAIASYDEDPGIWEIVGGKFYRDYAAPRDFFYPGNFHHQGNAYGSGRFSGEIWSAMLIDGMDAPEPWSLSAMSQVPYFFLYLRRPDGGFFHDGDDYLASTRPIGSYWAPPAQHWLNYTALFRDPQFAAQWRRQLETVETKFMWLDDPQNPALSIIYRPDRVPSARLEDLPLSRYFAEPLGAIVARTGWDIGPSSRDVAAYLKINTHRFDNHQHADSGQFQLFYRGNLAIDSGMYASTSGAYGSPHFTNYFRRAVAHNTILIEEPSETFSFDGKPIVNDFGQRSLDNAYTSEEFWEQPSRTGRVLATFIGHHPQHPEVSLIKGDLTPAYSDTKARDVTRTMAFFPLDEANVPAALVVLDRVESVRPDQRKAALLHSVEEPHVQGNVTTVMRTEKQIEILRVPPVLIDRLGEGASSASLIFDLATLRGRRVVRAELYCRVPWSRKGGLHVFDASRQIAAVDLAKVDMAPLPEVTAWLQDAVATAGQAPATAPLRVVRVDGDSRGVLDDVEGVHGPHLRVWVETEPTGGKLVQTTLLPAADRLELKKVGGPGHEFLAGEQNFPATPNIVEPMSGVEAGAWRVEVSDTSGRADARFFNVYQVMDHDAQPLPVRRIDGQGVVGASFGGRVFLASATSENVAAGATFELTEQDMGVDGTALLVLTDLPAGDHSLWVGDALKAMAAVEPKSHTMMTRLHPGQYVLKSR